MRSIICALAAAVLVFAHAGSASAQDEKLPPVKKLPPVMVPKDKAVRILPPGGRVEGRLVTANPKSKFLEVETDKGRVRVPVNSKLRIQNGLAGKAQDRSFGSVNELAARRVVVIVIRTGDVVIIVIIRTR